MLKPSRLTAAPPLRSGRLPFQGSLREPTNSAHNLSPSTRSEPFGSNKHRTDRLWQCQRQRLRRGERQAKISSVNSLNYPRPPSAVYSLNPVESGMRMNSLSSVSPTTSGGSGTTAQERQGRCGRGSPQTPDSKNNTADLPDCSTALRTRSREHSTGWASRFGETPLFSQIDGDVKAFHRPYSDSSLQTSKVRTPSIGFGRRITSGSASVRRASS